VVRKRVSRWYDGIVCVQGTSVEGGLKRALNVVTGLQSRRSSLWSAAWYEETRSELQAETGSKKISAWSAVIIQRIEKVGRSEDKTSMQLQPQLTRVSLSAF